MPVAQRALCYRTRALREVSRRGSSVVSCNVGVTVTSTLRGAQVRAGHSGECTLGRWTLPADRVEKAAGHSMYR